MRLSLRSPRLKLLLTAAVAGLAFELVAFSDFDGAQANDLDLLIVGGAGGATTQVPPPNIVFLFDTSRSMNNLPCQDFSGAAACDADHLQKRDAGTGATVCESPALRNVVASDTTGGAVFDHYTSPFDSPGHATRYTPVFEDTFASGSIWTQTSPDEAFTSVATGDLQAIIDSTCNQDDCSMRQRCIYSLEHLGYFWEPSGSTCGVGDPSGTCTGTSSGDLGKPCSRDRDCVGNHVCESGVCSTCNSDPDDCSGRQTCTKTGCLYSRCSNSDCSLPNGPFFTGDFLNFYPPKGIGLKGAFWSTITHLTGDVRLGVRDFSGGGKDIKPPCSQATGSACFDGDPATECFSPSNAQMLNYISALEFQNLYGTPIAYQLDAAGKSFSVSTGQNTPICDYSSVTSCSTNNFIVLVSDGKPTLDAPWWSWLPYVGKKRPDWPKNTPDNGSFADEVAGALRDIDARDDIPGAQQVSTYTVSYGLTSATDPNACDGLLDLTARSGDGRCLLAKDTGSLRDALATIVNEIIARSRGFTAPGVPTTRYTGTASVTTATFRPSTDFSPWEGHVYGFRLCDEKLGRETGTTCTCQPASNTDQICVQDAAGEPIEYDSDGYLASTPYWDAQLCLSGNVDGTQYAPPPPPDPHNLDISNCYVSAADRVIKTAIAGQANPADVVDEHDVVDFSAASVTSGSALLAALGAADVASGQKIVDFFRGYDVDDLNTNGDTTDERNLSTFYNATSHVLTPGWWKLGDIFHSVPNTVERPTGALVGTWSTTKSYQKFKKVYARRDKVMLVGANDGMLHAFQAGVWHDSLNNGDGGYDYGTGKELWAFVSPEMLPKLAGAMAASSEPVQKHPFLVDGSVMVRDVWVGGTDDKEVEGNYTKWKTVAIYGHRDGGTTYVALDVTDVSSPPKLLWQFPQPGAPEVTEMARSWLDTFPAPAAMGPLRELKDSKTIDHWVALLPGGFDPLDRTGRMLVAIEISTGEVVWKASHADTEGMDYSFAATPVFYPVTDANNRPYIGGIIAADHGGQLWEIPTPAKELTADGLFQFEPSVFFVAGPMSVSMPIPPNTDSTLVASEYQRWPFFFTPALTRHGNKVRVLIGTGDRDQLVPHDNTAGIGGTTGWVCTDPQRLYAIDVEKCGTRPCREDNLVEVKVNGTSSTYAPTDGPGWFYQLENGEKAATPFQIVNGYALYSTYMPTVACGGAGNVCTADIKGEGRLYARHYLSGKPLDWNGDNAITANEVYTTVGDGVPTPVAPTFGVSASGSTAAFLPGGPKPDPKSSSGLNSDLTQEIMRFYVSPEVHSLLHTEP